MTSRGTTMTTPLARAMTRRRAVTASFARARGRRTVDGTRARVGVRMVRANAAETGRVDAREGTAAEAAEATEAEDALECVAVGDAAQCVVAEEVVVVERDVSCVGVGVEASCDVSGTMDETESAATKRRKTRGPLASVALISPFFLWGTSMVAMKEVLPATSPMFVASVRLIPSGLILVAWALSKGRPMPKTAQAWGAVGLFAIVDAMMFQGFLAEGLQRTSAGLGSVIIDSQPLTVAILASLLFGETLGVEGIFGLALGVLGLLLLELPEDVLASVINGGDADGISEALKFEGSIWDNGEWWMLCAAQSMAVGTVMVRWVCKYVDPVMATGWHMALGGLPLLAYSLMSEPEMYSQLSLGAGDLASLAYASVFGGAVAYGAFFYFATKGSLTKLSSLTFLTPMFASAFGYLALDEEFTTTQLAGAVVTLIGIYFVNTRAKEADPSKRTR